MVLAEAVVGPVSLSHDSVSPSAQPTSVLSLPGQFLTECYLMIPSQSLLPKLPGLGSIPLGQVAFPAPKLPSYFVLCTHLNTVSGLIQVLCFAHFPNTECLAPSLSIVGTQQVKAGDMSGCVTAQWEELWGFQRPLSFFLICLLLEAVILWATRSGQGDNRQQ